MRVFLDANVLYPSILRGIILDFAKLGSFTPLWSERVIEEWRRAAIRNEEIGADIEIALLLDGWKDAMVRDIETRDDVTLTDPDDVHVVAAALTGHADQILTANTGDFPSRTLSRLGLIRRHPDEFLLEQYKAHPDAGSQILNAALTKAKARHKGEIALPALLKRMRLSRLRKYIQQT